MRAATTRTDSRFRRSNAVVKAAVGSAVLMAALAAAPAYASGMPNVVGKVGTAATVTSPQGGGSTWVETGPLSFNHELKGADGAYEHVSEVPDIKIPFPGVWEISYHARASMGASANAALFVHTALFKNGALIPGSEALTGLQSPALGFQGTAGQTILQTFAAGDVVRLQAYRSGPGVAAIASGSTGRTGIVAHWVSPGF